MGKVSALFVGSLIFLGVWIVVAVLLGQYVFSRTKDRSENGKYQRENRQ
jgi:hypothetical protein